MIVWGVDGNITDDPGWFSSMLPIRHGLRLRCRLALGTRRQLDRGGFCRVFHGLVHDPIGAPPLSLFGLLFWLLAILFRLSSWLHGAGRKAKNPVTNGDAGQTQTKKPRHFFILPSTDLGCWSLLIGTGLFLFMRLLDVGGRFRSRPQHLL